MDGQSRRDFLKSIGLGGVALTLPKPLSVVAAKVSDLEDPPIHAGCATFKIDRSYIWNDLLWNFPVNVAPSPRDYHRFIYGTTISIFFKYNRFSGEVPKRLKVSQLTWPMSHIPSILEWKRAKKPVHGWGLSLFPGEEVEIWCMPNRMPPHPHLLHGAISGKLLPVEFGMQGISRFDGGTGIWHYVSKMELVRLERARAIEMGLISSEEPEERWE